MMVTAQVPDLLIYDETQYVVDRLDEVLTQKILKGTQDPGQRISTPVQFFKL